MPDPNLSHSFLHCEMEIFIGRMRQYVEKRALLMSCADFFFCAFEGQRQTEHEIESRKPRKWQFCVRARNSFY